MGRTLRPSRLDTVFILIVFSVFAASVLLVLTLGGKAYRNMETIIRENDDERTCLSYIWTKVKNSDIADRIYIEEFHDISALCLEERYGDSVYRTMIYLYDGWLRELFSESGLEFWPEDGLPIIAVDKLLFEQLRNGLIRVTANSSDLMLYPRARTGLAYEEP